MAKKSIARQANKGQARRPAPQGTSVHPRNVTPKKPGTSVAPAAAPVRDASTGSIAKMMQ